MYAKTYQEKYASPLVRKLKNVIQRNLLHLIEKTQEFKSAIDRANNHIQSLSDRGRRLEPEVERLRNVEKDYDRIRLFLGGEHTDAIIYEVRVQEEARVQEIAKNCPKFKHEYVR